MLLSGEPILNLYRSPRILIFDLSWSTLPALPVEKYVVEQRADHAGVFVVTVGLSDVELLNVAAVADG